MRFKDRKEGQYKRHTHAREGISPLVRCERGRGRGGVGIVRARPCRRASMPNEGGVRWFLVRGGPVRRGSRAGVPCPETAGRRSTRPPAPPFSALAKPDSPPPPSLVGKKKKKKRRSLAHSNVGREGSRGPHHTTPRRLVRHSGVLPPPVPPLSLCRCCTHPVPCPGFDLPRCVVSSLGFSALVFSGVPLLGPSRLPKRQKKKKIVCFEPCPPHYRAAAKNLRKKK